MNDISVKSYRISLCDLCIAGEGDECHTPGCALWIHNSPGIPIWVTPGGTCELLNNEAT